MHNSVNLICAKTNNNNNYLMQMALQMNDRIHITFNIDY